MFDIDDPFGELFAKRRTTSHLRTRKVKPLVVARKPATKRVYEDNSVPPAKRSHAGPTMNRKRDYRETLDGSDLAQVQLSPPKVSKGEKTLSTKQDLERYFGRPLDEEANEFIDAAKQDMTIIPTMVEEGVMDVVDEALDEPDEFLEPEKFLAKLLRKRHHDELYEGKN